MDHKKPPSSKFTRTPAVSYRPSAMQAPHVPHTTLASHHQVGHRLADEGRLGGCATSPKELPPHGAEGGRSAPREPASGRPSLFPTSASLRAPGVGCPGSASPKVTGHRDPTPAARRPPPDHGPAETLCRAPQGPLHPPHVPGHAAPRARGGCPVARPHPRPREESLRVPGELRDPTGAPRAPRIPCSAPPARAPD